MRRSEFTVTADHHQFLVYSGNSPVITAASAGDTGDGLVAVSDGGLRIVTGTNYGPLAVRVELHNNEPPPPTAEWTEVSEVSFRVRVGPMEVGTLMDGPVPDGPDLAFAGTGWYRIRIAARGRDEASGGSESPTGPLFEHYVIAVWRAPRVPALSSRRSDRTGRAFRREPLGEKLDEAVEGPARDGFHTLVGLLRSGAATAVPGRTRIGLESLARSQPETVTSLLHNGFFWPGWLGGAGHHRAGEWTSTLVTAEDGLGIAGKAAFGIGGVVTSWDYRRLTEPSQDDPFPRFEECLPEPSVVDIGWVSVEGGTRVKLRHENLPELLGPAVTDLWRYYLARLVRHCKTGTWGDHPWDDARRTGGRPQASRRPAG